MSAFLYPWGWLLASAHLWLGVAAIGFDPSAKIHTHTKRKSTRSLVYGKIIYLFKNTTNWNDDERMMKRAGGNEMSGLCKKADEVDQFVSFYNGLIQG